MKLLKWEELPEALKTDEVRPYYAILAQKRKSLILKRAFDIIFSSILLIALLPFFVILAIIIKLDSKGPAIYRQERITQYGKRFRIHKFRTMTQNADSGSQVTVQNDARITRVGKLLRGCRLDEIPQLIDVLQGNLTLVGVRPESPKYVEKYTNEMLATLLLPAGVTNLACIYFKDEAKLLDATNDVDTIYVEQILPCKMYYNLKGILHFSFWTDIKIMFMTVFAVLGKKYENETSIYHYTNL